MAHGAQSTKHTTHRHIATEANCCGDGEPQPLEALATPQKQQPVLREYRTKRGRRWTSHTEDATTEK